MVYSEKALTKLNIVCKQSSSLVQSSSNNLVIDQKNGYSINSCWRNGTEYVLVTDLNFWNQPYLVKSVIDKVAHH